MPACPKPARRSGIRELREKRQQARAEDPARQPYQGVTAQRRAKKARAIVDAETIVKDEVKRLDGYKCRWPDCRDYVFIGEQYSGWAAILDPCHFQAEGMGGDSTLERCTLENLITLHRWHHERLHLGLARMRPLDDVLGMRGPVEFSAAVPGEAGKFYVCGVSSPPEGVMNGEA